ncbi:hypothetical protein LWI28_025589 [Acer negundo]|uniref:Uncharacterized protein n=1 Tax=Acer negundo TaxID=4023 RepID=A0AAD5INZ3_ACENE|nr:hypothetical protein LWI28_025589 [Acer negundo]
MVEIDFSAAENIMSRDLEISTEMDTESIRTHAGRALISQALASRSALTGSSFWTTFKRKAISREDRKSTLSTDAGKAVEKGILPLLSLSVEWLPLLHVRFRLGADGRRDVIGRATTSSHRWE